jgi:hypothetical protein
MKRAITIPEERGMDRTDHRKYYLSMMNVLYGLEDDFDANTVPPEARTLLNEIIEICKSDFNIQFGEDSDSN